MKYFGPATLCFILIGCSPSQSNKNTLLNLHNSIRLEHKLNPLKIDQELNQYAQKWAEKQPKFGKMTHSNLDFKGSERGENIAWGYWSDEEAFEGLINSPGHRANILNPRFKKIGFGYVKSYWVIVYSD